MENRILITGFEPFGGQTVNPSWEAVKQLPTQIGKWSLEKMQVPVVFSQAADLVWEKALEAKPQVILCVGQAGGRCSVTPEQVAINLRSGAADNAGNTFLDAPCVEGSPDAYFTTLPIRAMVEAMLEAEVPAAISYSAGTYVCNDLMYSLLHRCQGLDCRVGFVHIPFLPQQSRGQVPSLPLAVLVRALEACIGAL